MKTFKCITRSGREFDVEYTDNDNIMIALYDHFRGEPWGDCGGSCVCATCHVIIEEGHGLFGEATDLSELDLLDYAPGMIEGKSRLSCQCELRNIESNTVVVKVNHID